MYFAFIGYVLSQVMRDVNFYLLKDYLHAFVGDLPTQNEVEATMRNV